MPSTLETMLLLTGTARPAPIPEPCNLREAIFASRSSVFLQPGIRAVTLGLGAQKLPFLLTTHWAAGPPLLTCYL